jgi:hypothetical protein
MTLSLASSITKLGMVRFAVSRQMTLSGGEIRVSGRVELPAFLHEELLRGAPLPSRREAPAPREVALAPREKPSAPTWPRARAPMPLGMPWRWL